MYVLELSGECKLLCFCVSHKKMLEYSYNDMVYCRVQTLQLVNVEELSMELVLTQK